MTVNYPQFGTIESPLYQAIRVRSLAEELRHLSGQSNKNVFDPFCFAQSIGIKVQISPLPPGLAGRLRTDKGFALIELNAKDIPVRRRFTLCHELAHVCFWTADPIFKQRERSTQTSKFAREEQICNQIASELLMPSKIFVALAKKETPSYEGVRRLALHFDVSNAAVVRKIASTKGHSWVSGSMEWSFNEVGSLIRSVGVKMESRPRAKRAQSFALSIAAKAFKTAETIFLRQPFVLKSLNESQVLLAMPSPEVTISRGRTSSPLEQLVRGMVFFRL